jgi:hypothetical protein
MKKMGYDITDADDETIGNIIEWAVKYEKDSKLKENK